MKSDRWKKSLGAERGGLRAEVTRLAEQLERLRKRGTLPLWRACLLKLPVVLNVVAEDKKGEEKEAEQENDCDHSGPFEEL